jgi:hypothetical protein
MRNRRNTTPLIPETKPVEKSDTSLNGPMLTSQSHDPVVMIRQSQNVNPVAESEDAIRKSSQSMSRPRLLPYQDTSGNNTQSEMGIGG